MKIWSKFHCVARSFGYIEVLKASSLNWSTAQLILVPFFLKKNWSYFFWTSSLMFRMCRSAAKLIYMFWYNTSAFFSLGWSLTMCHWPTWNINSELTMKLSWIRRINLRIGSAATSATRVSENLAPYRPRLSYFFLLLLLLKKKNKKNKNKRRRRDGFTDNKKTLPPDNKRGGNRCQWRKSFGDGHHGSAPNKIDTQQ